MTELEFADRLRKYRKAKQMTQQELAERLGVSDKSVSRWENGSYPDVAMLGPLARELGVTVDDLLGTVPPLQKLERSDLQNWLSYAFAIGGGIVVQLRRVAGGKADLWIDAPREVPVVRGTVLERNGGERPACLEPPSGRKPKGYRDRIFRWNDDRERAVRAMKRIFDKLEADGAIEEVKALRTQLDRIIPDFWEEDLAE